MNSIKCSSCGLTNWASDLKCKRCDTKLDVSKAKEQAAKASDIVFSEKWGLQEFGVEGPDGIPVWKIPQHLGITGCIKLIGMLATAIVLVIYGGQFFNELLPDWFGMRLKYAIALVILLVPIVFLSLLSARIVDTIMKVLRIKS